MAKGVKPIQNKNPNRQKASGFKNNLERIVELSVDKSARTGIGNASAEVSLPPTQKYNDPSQNKSKHLPAPDVSSILKEDVDPYQDYDLDEFADNPLHSTALECDGEEHLENAVPPQHEKLTRSVKASPPKKRLEKRKNLSTTDMPEKKSRKASQKENLKKDITPKKTSTHVQAPEPSITPKSARKTQKSKQLQNSEYGSQDEVALHTSGTLHTSGAAVQGLKANVSPNSKSLSQTPAELSSETAGAHQSSKSLLSAETAQPQAEDTVETSQHSQKDKSKGKNNKLQKKDFGPSHQDEAVVGSNSAINIWCPDDVKRSSRDLTELDIVLSEFEDIITDYKLNVDSDVCLKAIDLLFSNFKEQVTGTIDEIKTLKSMKRKNVKLNNEIGKKRRRLVEVRGEHLVTEPQLKQMQKEYTQLEVKKSSLKSATQFLSDLKDLQKGYMEYRNTNPKEKEVYGMTSLPALLLESRTILGAEKHFQNINSKLQNFLD